jgi:hypothetical protein
VSPARWLFGFSIILAVGGLAHVSNAQDAAASPETGLPRVLRFGITDQQVDMRAYTRDDLREVPSPRLDRRSDQVRFSVSDGDPLCLPGRGVWAGPTSATGHFPGVGRPR